MDADQELRSLKRGLKVLALLNQVESVGISELAVRLDLPRTTAERILLTLAAEGYVHRLPNDKRYRLSAKVCNLARGFSDDSWIIHVATPLLFDMTRRIGWPLGIATPSGDTMVLRMTTDPATSLYIHRRRVGAEIPRLAASSGLVSYAFAPPAERTQLLEVLKTSPHRVNAERANNAIWMESMIGPVAADGYAFQPPPTDAPERSVSVPIWINGSFVAVLLMMYMPRVLKNAVVLRDYLPMILDLAEKIGDRVSHSDGYDTEDTGAVIKLSAQVTALGSAVG